LTNQAERFKKVTIYLRAPLRGLELGALGQSEIIRIRMRT